MPKSGSYKWLVVVLFWLIYFLNQADRQVLFSVFPLVKQDLRLSDTQLGLLGSAFFWVYAILVPIAGNLGDVLSRKNLIVFALLLWSAATCASGLTGGLVLLIVFRALTGGGEAFYYPSANSILSDYHGQETRALAMGIHQTSVYFGIVASGTLAGYVGQQFGWRWAFVGFGTAGVLLAALAWRTLREPARGAAEGQRAEAPLPAPPSRAAVAPATLSLKQRLYESVRTPTALLLMGAFVGFKLVDAAYLTWMPTLLYRKFGLSLATAGFHATFWHHVGAALGVLAGGRLADRYALRSRLSRPLVQVVGLIGGAPFIFLLGWSADTVVVYGSLALFGVFRGLYDSNLFASLYEVVRPEGRATATGLMLSVAFLAGGTAPLVIGWLGQRLGLGLALASTAVFFVAAGGLILFDCGFCFRRDAERMRSSLALAVPMKLVEERE
jgi:MFS family permease